MQYCDGKRMATSALRVVSAEGPILDTILDASFTIWHEGLTREAYGRWYTAQLKTPYGRRRLKRMALVDRGDVLASAKLYEFDAHLDGRRARVVGIGAVFTQPAHRGRGHARDLIERLLERASQDGFEMALLFSEIGATYYERLGFAVIPTVERVVEVAMPPGRGAPAALVRAGDDRDLPAIADMGRSRAARYRFHVDRDPDLIQYAIARRRLLAGLGPAGLREVQFFVAEEGASAVAYVVLGVERHDAAVWTITECGDRDPSGARVGAILQTLIAREPPDRRPSIRGRLPAGFLPPQMSVADTRPTADVMMIRMLSGQSPAPLLGDDDVLFWQADVF